MKRPKIESEEIFRLIDAHRFEDAEELIHPKYRPHPDLNGGSGDTWPLMHYASRHGRSDVVEYLLNKGNNIERKDSLTGCTPLLAAARNNQEECCELLINRGANIEARDSREHTPFISAAARGHVKVCKLLIDKGADINAHIKDGSTALHYAIWNDNVTVTKFLLSANMRIERNMIVLARLYHRTEHILLLENHSVTVNLSGVISRGLINESLFSGFLVFSKINDPRLFIIIANFAYP